MEDPFIVAQNMLYLQIIHKQDMCEKSWFKQTLCKSLQWDLFCPTEQMAKPDNVSSQKRNKPPIYTSHRKSIKKKTQSVTGGGLDFYFNWSNIVLYLKTSTFF